MCQYFLDWDDRKGTSSCEITVLKGLCSSALWVCEEQINLKAEASIGSWIWIAVVRMEVWENPTTTPHLRQMPVSAAKHINLQKRILPCFGWPSPTCRLNNCAFRFPLVAGGFISSPHRKDDWFIDEDKDELYRVIDNKSYQLFTPSTLARRTRRTRFSYLRTVSGLCPRHTRASILPVRAGHWDDVMLHSSAAVYLPCCERQSFINKILALPNQSLWRTLEVDGDGSWIYRGLLLNSLVLMSDGSYNEALANDVCSSASLIICRESGQRASVTWVEKSNAHTADNYRAELLGAVALQTLISTAVSDKYVSMDMAPRFGCDNKTVVHHGNHPRRPMPEKQSQADVLRHLKQLIRDAPYKARMYHVYGHLDQLLAWSELTLEERMRNVITLLTML